MYLCIFEFFVMRGILGCFLDKGMKVFFGYFLMLDIWLDFFWLDFKQNYLLMLFQVEMEWFLEEYVLSLGVDIICGVEVVVFIQMDDGVEMVFWDESGICILCSLYVVGIDGVGSFVWKQVGIVFLGIDVDLIGIFCDVVLKNLFEFVFFLVCCLQGLVVIVFFLNGFFCVFIVFLYVL